MNINAITIEQVQEIHNICGKIKSLQGNITTTEGIIKKQQEWLINQRSKLQEAQEEMARLVVKSAHGVQYSPNFVNLGQAHNPNSLLGT